MNNQPGGWYKLFRDLLIIVGIGFVALWIIILIAAGEIHNEQVQEQYVDAVALYNNEEYEDALLEFYSLTQYREDAFDGLSPAAYVELCKEHVHVAYCPHCDGPLILSDLEERYGTP